MSHATVSAVPQYDAPNEGSEPVLWISRTALLWKHRRRLLRVTIIAFFISLLLAFLIPKRYKAVATIMPPEQQGSGAMLLAALAGRSGALGSLGSLMGGAFSSHPSSALYEDLLESGTVRGHLIDRFHLQQEYRTRYRFSTIKHLASLTTITDNKKSGVITIAVEDADPARARDLAQAYLDELNNLLTRTSTSSARQERLFIESRLHSVGPDLEQAQVALSQFSSNNRAIDLKEQTRGLVEAGARVQGELLVEQSGLESLRQIYGDGNVRVRETEARITSLQRALAKMTGSSAAPTPDSASAADQSQFSPALRQLPALAVSYADLYRRVKVQESIFELLTQQYEMARLQEAKDTPTISVIDAPGIPEKKSFPPRLLLTLILTLGSFAVAATQVILRDRWSRVTPSDPRRQLADEVLPILTRPIRSVAARLRGAA